jgi:hypothetical protein
MSGQLHLRGRKKRKTSRVPHMDIDIDMLDYRMTVAYEDLMILCGCVQEGCEF